MASRLSDYCTVCRVVEAAVINRRISWTVGFLLVGDVQQLSNLTLSTKIIRWGANTGPTLPNSTPPSSRATTFHCVGFDTAPRGKGPAHWWTSVVRCILGSWQWDKIENCTANGRKHFKFVLLEDKGPMCPRRRGDTRAVRNT